MSKLIQGDRLGFSIRKYHGRTKTRNQSARYENGNFRK